MRKISCLCSPENLFLLKIFMDNFLAHLQHFLKISLLCPFDFDSCLVSNAVKVDRKKIQCVV